MGSQQVIERRETMREAEKDLVYAAAKLQSGELPAAYLNAAIAVVRLGKCLSPSDHDLVLSAVTELRERLNGKPGS